MPLIDMVMTCIDRDDDIISTASSCLIIEIDERTQFGPFIGTRPFSNRYEKITIEQDGIVEDLKVYNRPVCYNLSKTNESNHEIEVILFTGKRWMITSLLFFYEVNKILVPINILPKKKD